MQWTVERGIHLTFKLTVMKSIVKYSKIHNSLVGYKRQKILKNEELVDPVVFDFTVSKYCVNAAQTQERRTLY